MIYFFHQQDSDDEFAAGLTFAPKDVNPVDFLGKDDVHGLGYSGINPRTAFGSTGKVQSTSNFALIVHCWGHP